MINDILFTDGGDSIVLQVSSVFDVDNFLWISDIQSVTINGAPALLFESTKQNADLVVTFDDLVRSWKANHGEEGARINRGRGQGNPGGGRDNSNVTNEVEIKENKSFLNRLFGK